MRLMVTAAACAGLALAGCGSSDDKSSGGSSSGSSGGGGAGLDISAPADGSKKFTKSDLTAKAGTVTVKFDNPSSVPHGVEIEGNGVEQSSDVVTGADTSFTVDLKAGKYEFYCPVGNHRAAGMEGTLTVE
jgi:plastocyanin